MLYLLLVKVICLLQGLTIVKPIVYGNIARYFGKKREEDGHTHQWTVYVKPYKNEVYFIFHTDTVKQLYFASYLLLLCHPKENHKN